MPSPENTETILLALAAFLFAFAFVSLVAWSLKTFVLGGRGGAGYLKGRDRRLGVVETALVDAQRSPHSPRQRRAFDHDRRPGRRADREGNRGT